MKSKSYGSLWRATARSWVVGVITGRLECIYSAVSHSTERAGGATQTKIAVVPEIGQQMPLPPKLYKKGCFTATNALLFK